MQKYILGAILASMLFIGGCSTLQNSDASAQLPIQYATLKLIEQSDSVDAEGVIDTVKTARALMQGEDQEIDLKFLSNGVRANIDWESLDTSDKLLINTLITEIESVLDRQYDIDAGLSEDAKIRIGTLLDYIESAANMAQ